jgi:hypothetical protein
MKSAFSCQLSIIPQLNDDERRHQLRIHESSYGTSFDSSSSEEQRKSGNCEHKKTKKPKSCGNKKKEKDKDGEPKKNTCPHCKKYHRKKSHCVESDKCMWNKKYKGYRVKSICNELEVDFKPRIKFTACGEGRFGGQMTVRGDVGGRREQGWQMDYSDRSW